MLLQTTRPSPASRHDTDAGTFTTSDDASSDCLQLEMFQMLVRLFQLGDGVDVLEG